MEPVQIIGYFASALIAVSLMMSSIVKLRIINFFGASIFSTYGFIIGAYPVGILNGFITLVDIYYLTEIFFRKENEFFRVLEVKTTSEYLNYFLKYYEKDIKKFMPSFLFSPCKNCHVMFVLRNAVPAGLVISEYSDDESIHVRLDYAIPGYRDFKMGKYVFNEIFKQKKVKNIYSDPGNEKHEIYLKKMGFIKKELNEGPIYHLEVEGDG
ncbi:MAG TPA: hypothetical protein PLZ15_05375 [Melioribacteraceae bacterium]|nr:hypothetical protein [Melioribacteraceae bacterium]